MASENIEMGLGIIRNLLLTVFLAGQLLIKGTTMVMTMQGIFLELLELLLVWMNISLTRR